MLTREERAKANGTRQYDDSRPISADRISSHWEGDIAVFNLESAQEDRSITLRYTVHTGKWSGKYIRYDDAQQDWVDDEPIEPGKAERIGWERGLIVCR